MGIIIATLIVVVVIASALAQDFAIFSWDYWLEGGNALRSEVVRNLGLLAAAAIGLVVGSWRAVMGYMQARASQRQAEAANEQADSANQQVRIAQQGHITNLFSTAVEQLGSQQLPVRLGGIYALWRLIKDSPDRVISVIDILCAFLRDPPYPSAHRPEPDTNKDFTPIRLRSDVQAILDLIADPDTPYRALLPDGYRLNLTGAKLMFASLMNADLRGVRLTDADLTVAHLTVADLRDADLRSADLSVTYLMGANLTHADLAAADLGGADLLDADLTGADLTGAFNLTQDQLDSACISKGGKPPALSEGLKPPQKVCGPRKRWHGHDVGAAR